MFSREIVLAICLVAGFAASQSGPIPPTQDPWYQAPAGYESTAPGTILRFREAPGNLTSVYNHSSAAYNILYRSTDSNYLPTWAVTTLFAPKKNLTSRAPSLVSFQIPYNTPNLDASPSYLLYNPFRYNVHGTVQLNDIQRLLDYGAFVNVPDHEGPRAAFACTVQEGHAVLDSIRAAKTLMNPSNDTRIVMMGYSGGSLASEFAAELQVQYAPELEFAGMVIGGLIANVSASFGLVSGHGLAGFLPAALVGLTKQHADLNRTLYASLKQEGPYNATTFLSVNKMNSVELVAFFANQTMSNYFTTGSAFFQHPSFLRALNRDAVMGYHGTPQMPMFVYQAVGDELSSIALTDALVDRYCGVGANIQYHRNPVGGHIAQGDNGDPGALDWVHSVINGTWSHTGCTIQNVAVNITDSPI